MSFRTRVFLAIAAGVLVPLGLLAYGVRREVSRQLASQYDARVAALSGLVHSALVAESRSARRAVAAITADLDRDNDFRLAVARQDDSARVRLLDYASARMRFGTLSMLQLDDGAGLILSSGHFRNEFGRTDHGLPRAIAAAPADAPVLVRVRTADGPLFALAAVDSLRVNGGVYFVLGGRSLDPASLSRFAPDSNLSAAIVTRQDTIGGRSRDPGSRVLGRELLAYIDAAGDGAEPASAWVEISLRPGELALLRRGIDRWFVIAFGATLVLSLLLAAWLSTAIGRPIARLAEKTAALDLDRLDEDFGSDRTDEIGALSRLLAAMTARLRSSAVRLRDAERRATVADVARQVNHDVKNGVAPIRHVVRHLAEVARDDPARLADVFGERRGTLDSSVEYLETLARNYARLSPASERVPCDVNAIVRQVAAGAGAGGRTVALELAAALPPVALDSLAFRRVLENLTANAVDSLGAGGRVTLGTQAIRQDSANLVRVVVADTGRGMSPEELERAFGDFYTTKPDGTGLGLSVVRRLVADLGASLRVRSTPGAGTEFTIDFPSSGGDAI